MNINRFQDGKIIKNRKSRSDLIIASAKKLFDQHGFHKTSLADIANTLNLTKASIYYYFSSKEELFKGVIRHEAKELFSRMHNMTHNMGSVEEQFKKAVASHIKEWLSFPLVKGLFTRPPQRQAAVVAELRQEVFEEEVHLIEEIFTKGRREGRFKITHPKILAQTIVTAVHGIEVTAELNSQKRFIEEFAQVVLRGIAGKDPGPEAGRTS